MKKKVNLEYIIISTLTEVSLIIGAILIGLFVQQKDKLIYSYQLVYGLVFIVIAVFGKIWLDYKK